MARAQSTDFFHNFKFMVRDANGGDVLGAKAQGGFDTCTIPELSLDLIEYKEGIMTYKRKFPGSPTVTDVTMTRGVAKNRTSFKAWALASLQGEEYRTDLTIEHYHRDDYLSIGDKTGDLTNASTVAPTRSIKLKQAFAYRVKPGSDFDANGSEVSIEELDVAVESFEVLNDTTAILANTGIKGS